MHKESSRTHTEPPNDLTLSLAEEVGDENTLNTVIEHYRAWLPKYQEFSQGRSNFQIEKMIATEHVTPAASYQHTLFQLRIMHQGLMDDFVRGIERTREFEYKWKGKSHDEPQWWEVERGGKKLCWYDTDRLRLEHEIEELKMSVKDKLLQLQTFTKVLTAMEAQHGGNFTHQDLNDEEPEYWKHRLARQMTNSYLDRETGMGTGNINSLRMALAESPVPLSPNKVTEFPDLFNAVLGNRESALEIINEVNEQLFKHMNTLGAPESTLRQNTHPTLHTTEDTDRPLTDKLRHAGIDVSDKE